jgi:GNAT superfamily N-acetyltransferase
VIKEIRCAVPEERAALRELHRRSSLVWEEDRAALTAHPEVFGVDRAAIDQRRVRVAVAHDGELLGFSGVIYDGRGTCVLDDLFVDPDRFRHGVGSTLIEDAVDRAIDAGNAEMTVIAHPRVLRFYEHTGFSSVGPAQTRFGPALLLRRGLADGREARRSTHGGAAS